MGPNSRLYLSLVDSVFHRKSFDALGEHVTASYSSHDPFFDATRRELSELTIRELRELRYEVCDVFESADRVAARFILLGRRLGRRIAVPGISISRIDGGRLGEGWIVADYTDVADFARPAATPADAWAGTPLSIAAEHPDHATSRLAAYRWLVDQTYVHRRPEAVVDAFHPAYVGFDPFRDRGTSLDALVEFQHKLIAMYPAIDYHIVDAVEDGDRLAVRYRAEGVDRNGRRVVVPGMSINHFEGTRIRRGWTLNHYGALSS